ncbi:hypothetical protein JCM8547_008906 [Rhodosporidiobolus lusitaniae]
MKLLPPLLALLPTLAQGTTALQLDLTLNASAVIDLLSRSSSSLTPDYIVVGGGNAGLAVAARLAVSNSSLSVVVLEAGPSAVGNPGVDVPGLAGTTFMSGIDWAFSTTPQENAANRSVYWPRGKVLGGSSALNFLVSTRPNKAEHDAWASLSGNSGWSWASLLPFYKKAEHFFPPGPNTQNASVSYLSSAHGTAGPISTSYPPYLAAQFSGFFQALRFLGVPVAVDLHSGNNHGVSYAPSTMHNRNGGIDRTRSYAVDYLPLAPNLVVITSAQATRINWAPAKDPSGNVVASGVSFVPTGQESPSFVLTAEKDVILSAGTVQSPQLLELSGVGNPKILKPLGIETVIDLPGVGENLQDHPAIVNVYKLKPNVTSLDDLANPAVLTAALAEFATGQGVLTEALYPLSYLTLNDFTSPSDLSTIADLGSQAKNPQLSNRVWNAYQGLYGKGVPVLELLGINVYFGNSTGEPGESYISLAGCLQHALSRGSVHISSPSPLLPPLINPHYLSSPLDTFLLKRASQYLRRVAAQPGLARFIEEEVEPGRAVEEEGEWEEWVRGTVRTEYHPLGTSSLLPLSQGGVVSPSSLRVYGTANVRVVDLSVAPLHVGSHTQTVAYAVAEKAAALILSGL